MGFWSSPRFLWKFWGRFFLNRVGVILGPLGIILGAFGGHFGSFRGHFGDLGASLGDFLDVSSRVKKKRGLD